MRSKSLVGSVGSPAEILSRWLLNIKIQKMGSEKSKEKYDRSSPE